MVFYSVCFIEKTGRNNILNMHTDIAKNVYKAPIWPNKMCEVEWGQFRDA
jgi:hypothetical protein